MIHLHIFIFVLFFVLTTFEEGTRFVSRPVFLSEDGKKGMGWHSLAALPMAGFGGVLAAHSLRVVYGD